LIVAEAAIELLCIGNAMVDIFAGAEGETLDRLGLTEAVQHVTPEQMGRILGILGIHALPRASGFFSRSGHGRPLVWRKARPFSEAVFISSGGGAANAAKIAAFLGITTAFIGSVGGAGGEADPAGRLFKRDLEEAGAVPRLILTGQPTGICLYLRAGPDLRIAASPSAALALSPEDIPEGAIRNARVIVPDGYLLGRRDDLVRRIMDTARRFRKTVALDAGSAALAESRAAELAAYCRDSRLILFMNEDEAAAFCRAGGGGGEKERFLRDLASGGPFPIIVEKLGERGATVYAGGRVCRRPAMPVQPVESTGAGDAFCGAFLAAWLRGRPVEECAELGNRAAGAILRVPGAGMSRERFRKLGLTAPAGPASSPPPR
jgi:sugar/nucleoside kinase (ribokinase family)